MKTAVLYSNPYKNPTALIGILNPKEKGGVKNMAKKRSKSHRASIRGHEGNYYIPLKSRLFPHHAGQSVSWNPRHRRHHKNPLPNMDWKDIGIVLGAGAVGLLVGITGPGYLNKISFLNTKTSVNELITIGIGAALGYGTYKMFHSTEAGVVVATLPALAIGATELQAAVPSIFPSWSIKSTTTAAAIPAAPAAPAVPAGTSGIALPQGRGMGNVVKLHQIGG